MNKSKPTAIDLFCGADGLTTDLKKAGFKVLAGFELDNTAAETYKPNHRKTRVFISDISRLNPTEAMAELKLEKGELDLPAGCPPCQGFLTHKTWNKSSSVKNEQNDPTFSVLESIKTLEPKIIIVENVPGLAKDPRIEEFKSEIGPLGYKIDKNTIQVLDAADFGVPQGRKRTILQAPRFGYISPPTPVRKRKTVKQVIGKLLSPGLSGDVLHNPPFTRNKKVNEIIKNVPRDGGSRAQLPLRLWLPCHIKRPGSYRDVYGRMVWNDVSPTITGSCTNPSKGRFIHPEQDRAITLREAALLQTSPQNYKLSLKKGKDFTALMIGNALPPYLIYTHAEKHREHLNIVNIGDRECLEN